jgi:hypothetical protein
MPMTLHSDVEKPSGVRLWMLLAILALLVIVLAFAQRAGKSKRSQFVPGVGAIDVSSGKPLFAGERATSGARGAGGGMRGGGGARAGMGAPSSAEYAPAPPSDAALGFESQPAAYTPQRAAPMLIRTASLRLRVDDVAKAHDEVARIAREAHGYVAGTQLTSEYGPASATITLRLPSEGLDSAIDRISALGKLLSKELGTEEVTEEYVDLTSRKRNLEREEQRLLELLQRAGKMSDLLQVEQYLGNVRGQIEQITGRMRYLENRVALSTLTVVLQGPEPKPGVGGPVWTARDEFRQAGRSLRDTGRGLATLGIWLSVFVPVWLPLLLILIWLVRRAFPGQQAPQARSE